MERNALTAGVAHDGVKNRTEIKVLICGLLSRASEKIDRSDIVEIICRAAMANYFELVSSVDELITTGNIIAGEDGALSVDAAGVDAADELWSHLPVTVREKTLASMKEYCDLRRSKKQNGFRIEQLSDGGCRVYCSINNRDDELMGISFYLPDKSYAKDVRERFYRDPERIYRIVLAQLTGDMTLMPEDADQ